jgi:CDP-diacylglycerol--glycerol-3-phosphate 3-phosphatidyltransferase
VADGWDDQLAASGDSHSSPSGDAAGGIARPSGGRERSRHAVLTPEVFWNLPNTVTMLRMGVVPVLLFLPVATGVSGSRLMAVAYVIAALTDLLDGWLARRYNGRDITRIGTLLDPLADKLLVSTALVMLLGIGRIPLWGAGMVVVIIGRELAVTGLRGIASSQGQVVAASWPGKLKTLAQNVATVALLLHHETLGLPAHAIGMTLLAVATVLTLWSGYTYFSDFFGGAGAVSDPPAEEL